MSNMLIWQKNRREAQSAHRGARLHARVTDYAKAFEALQKTSALNVQVRETERRRLGTKVKRSKRRWNQRSRFDDSVTYYSSSLKLLPHDNQISL